MLEDGQLQLMAILAGRLGTVAAASNNGLFQVVWFLSSFMCGNFDMILVHVSHISQLQPTPQAP